MRNRRPSPAGVAIVLGCAAVAILARGGLLLRSGLLAVGTYDDGVHYAIAAALVHGRLPYRDVLFLQPPGVALAVAPFAALAPAVGDPAAFAAAKLAFVAIGGLNALLVAALLLRRGRGAALTGGLLYALASPLVYTERTIALETLGSTGVLAALLLLRAANGRDARLALLAGAAAGAAIACKGWYVIAFAVLLVAARGERVRFLLGGLLAGAATCGAFLLADPGAMWRQVVVAQLGRPRLGDQPLPARIASILGVSGIGGPTSLAGVDPVAVTAVLGVLAAVLCGIALVRPEGRVYVALVVAGAALLLLSPSYYLHYAVLTAGPLALVAGTATGVVLARVRRRSVRAVVTVVALVAVVGLNLRHDLSTVRLTDPPAGLAAAARTVRGCVVADDPGLLADLGTLSSDLAAGCRLQADPSGISYTTARFTIDGVAVDRDRNPRFQRAMTRYLLSGAAHVVVRPGALLLDERARAELARGRVLYERGPFRLVGTR